MPIDEAVPQGDSPSCRRFEDNQSRPRLFALAYNLAIFLRQVSLPQRVRTWALTTLQETLIKIGAKVLHNAKAVLFAAILERIGRLRAGPSRPGSDLVRSCGRLRK